MPRFSKYIFFLILFITPALLFPQGLIHRHLTIEDGLVQSNINNIYEDNEGYLWFSTMAGVSRWDGANFLNFQTSDGLPAAQVYQIYGAPDSAIYFATYGGGICRYKNGRLEKVFPELDKIDNDLACIRGDSAGNLYIAGYRGIIKRDIYGNFTLFDSSRSIWSMTTGRTGSIYFGSYTAGIKILKNDRWKSLTQKDGLADNAIWNMIEASDSTLYIATNKGASAWKNGSFFPLKGGSALKNERVIGLFEDHRGGIYFGTVEGIVYNDHGSIQKMDISNGLSINDVWSIYEDRFGLVYFGTGGNGIDIYQPGKIQNYTQKSGLNDNVVRTVYVNKKNVKYFGTDMGVTVWDRGSAIFLTDKKGLAGNKVRKIIGDDQGAIYIGTRTGLSILKNGKLRNLKKKDGLIDDAILSLHFGQFSKKIYICTRAGVSVLSQGKVVANFNRGNGMIDDYISCALEVSADKVYFGTYLGVAILDHGKWDTLKVEDGLADHKVVSIHRDKQGYLYFGTYGKGLTVLSPDGRMNTLDMQSGLSSNSIWSIEEDEMGQIYLATGKGITILTGSGGSGVMHYLGYEDGLCSSENNRDASFKDHLGKLWFGTVAGASCYDPAFNKPVKIAPAIHIQNLEVLGKETPLEKREFSYTENFFNIRFIGIYFPAPEKVIYKYRLISLNDKYTLTTERFARYTNLDPGHYTFEVSAKNPWGFESDPVTYDFIINPPFWATVWFRLIIFLVLAAVVWWLYHIKINRIIQMERLRTGIASDLHDEVGSALTRIFMGAESIKNSKDLSKIDQIAARISENSKEMLQTFSDIIWGIEARNDTLGDLIERMQDFSHRMFAERNMEIITDIHFADKKKPLEGKKRQNIYLIFKEAMNNILKHSDADRITLSFHQEDKTYSLQISDNGKEIDRTGTLGGYGLESMKKRAEELGGELLVEQKNGFTVKAIIPE